MPLITLTTDFGVQDWFVGTMKGVILSIHKSARMVDITHGIAPGNIRAGAFALAASYHYFPRRTIHVVVVDPGVGSQRQAIVVRTKHYDFVAPDNGVLSFALAQEEIVAAHRLENARFFCQPVSQTFHGRDIFAPVSAHLSRGVAIAKFGPTVKEIHHLEWPTLKFTQDTIYGEVVYIDHFGNAITNITAQAIDRFVPNKTVNVFIGRRKNIPFSQYYQSVPIGKPLALLDSSGLVEVAIHGGSAQQHLGLAIGSSVGIRLRGH